MHSDQPALKGRRGRPSWDHPGRATWSCRRVTGKGDWGEEIQTRQFPELGVTGLDRRGDSTASWCLRKVGLRHAWHRPRFLVPSSHHGPLGSACTLRRRKFNEERRLVIRQETQKLLSDGHIMEIQYPEWLANVVLVKKANGKWRMCVDFTDLNKACPEDSYPLPSIDALVDNASGCRLFNFLDAFSKYNQIRMHPEMSARRLSWQNSLIIAIRWCPSGSRMQAQPIRGWWTECSPLW